MQPMTAIELEVLNALASIELEEVKQLRDQNVGVSQVEPHYSYAPSAVPSTPACTP